MPILLLIRHATNDFVKTGRLPGQTPNIHLNEEGRKQAEALGESLRKRPLDAVYSSQLERAIETLDGDGLADSERFEDALDDLPDERLGAMYVDTAAVKDLAAADPTLDPAGRQFLEQFLGEGEPVTGALVAEEDAVRGEFRVATDVLGPFGSLVSGEAPELLAQLPGDSWVAFGYEDIGGTVDSLIATDRACRTRPCRSACSC